MKRTGYANARYSKTQRSPSVGFVSAVRTWSQTSAIVTAVALRLPGDVAAVSKISDVRNGMRPRTTYETELAPRLAGAGLAMGRLDFRERRGPVAAAGSAGRGASVIGSRWLAERTDWRTTERRLAAEPAPWDFWIEGETMQQSEQINELAEALAKAQARIKGASKDSENPFFRSRYADLASVWDACREPLTAEGLSVIQGPATEFTGEPQTYTYKSRSGEERSGVRVATRVSVTTRLLHASGQWIEETATAMLPTGDPQAVGSAITYLRRYGLQSVAGVAPEDDDGEATARPVPASERKPARPFGVNEHGAFVVPGKAIAWGGYGSREITDTTVPLKVLNALHNWLLNPPGDFDADAGPLLKAVEAELDNRGNGKPPDAATPEPQGSDDFLMMRMQLTKAMKACPELFSAADEKAMRTWIDAPERTFPEVVNKVAEVQERVEKHRAEKETGKRRSKEPTPAA